MVLDLQYEKPPAGLTSAGGSGVFAKLRFFL
jgi:hypothetical protein